MNRKQLGSYVLSDIQQRVSDAAFTNVIFDHNIFFIFTVVTSGLSFEFQYDWSDLEQDRQEAVASLVSDIQVIVENTKIWKVR